MSRWMKLGLWGWVIIIISTSVLGRISPSLSFVPYAAFALALGTLVLAAAGKYHVAGASGRRLLSLVALALFFYGCTALSIYSIVMLRVGKPEPSPPSIVKCHPGGWRNTGPHTVYVTPDQLNTARHLAVGVPVAAMTVTIVLVLLGTRRPRSPVAANS
jgi:hypothetical protein